MTVYGASEARLTFNGVDVADALGLPLPLPVRRPAPLWTAEPGGALDRILLAGEREAAHHERERARPPWSRDPVMPDEAIERRLTRAAARRDVSLSERDLESAVTGMLDMGRDPLTAPRLCIFARHGKDCRHPSVAHDCDIPF